ncbi:uncharacterized protein LOC128266898 [Anopheles cruzii]|uniref:uncharacterized protein LOC128266898 n=1 Tax=Anopheles cruzii TaxID=68878 RepID=UPI0022EC8BBF|nr:uncharacterized protein LOC128266898 [Anopheles cruzii]
MFSCLWQLWDWIDPPTFTTMESKKLQQLQQANSHLAPMPQLKAPGFQQPPPGGYDYGTAGGGTTLAVGRFVGGPGGSGNVAASHQYQAYAANFAQHPALRSPYSTGSPKSSLSATSGAMYGATDGGELSSNSGGGAGGQSHLLHPHFHPQQQQQQYRSNNTIGGSNYGFDQQQQQQHLQRVSSPSSSGERERLYQTAPLVRGAAPVGTPHSVTSSSGPGGGASAMSKLELQFQQLQREKIQQQIKTATEAIAHQQQTFALRQQLNPPVPNYHLKQNLLQNLSQQHQQQIQHQQQQQQIHQQQQQQQQQQPQQQQSLQKHVQQQQQAKQSAQKAQHTLKQQQHHQQQRYPGNSQNRNVPPSSLNLMNHCQPAGGESDKLMRSHGPTYHGPPEEESLYQKSTGGFAGVVSPLAGANGEIIIQQNIPGQVVNQACQTQISSMHQQGQSQMKPSPSDTLSSPSHDAIERKRSSGGGSGSGQQHTLKSPVTKRPANAPVALSGWLYKQGSDGLKVWRRRWFVLSEYVLYYYKSPEEEKLLGTVLLPSYRVSACFPEDKIYRKFAFKCEHANMRTFVFAAENGESMSQWVRALTLATMMMQGVVVGPGVGGEMETGANALSSDSSSGNTGGGGGGGQSGSSSENAKVGHGQATAGGSGSSGSSGGGGPGTNSDGMSLPQPLYANAPPKPRRVNDAGYSSPSPDHAIIHDRYEQMMQQQQQQHQQQQQKPQQQHLLASVQFPPGHPSRIAPTLLTANAIYGDPKRIERDLYIQKLIEQQQQQQQQQQQSQLNASKQQSAQQAALGMHSSPLHGQIMRGGTSGPGTNPFLYPNSDRRTPDTYGPPNSAVDPKHMSDYEDIYNLTMLSKSLPANGAAPLEAVTGGVYKRPSSPQRYTAGVFQPYVTNAPYNGNQFEVQNVAMTPEHQQQQQQHSVHMRSRPVPPSIPRPHSADFLDYEARHPLNHGTGRNHANDEQPNPHRTPRPKSSLDINRTPDHYYYSEASYAEKMRLQSASYLQRANKGAVSRKQRSDDMQGLFAGGGTMPRDGLYRSASGKIFTAPQQQPQPLSNNNADEYHHPAEGSQSMPRPSTSDRGGGGGRPSVQSLKKPANAVQQQQEQFARSASARLPRKEEDASLRDGERKREESMKRLLEWKQRMLQSPLTKKITSQQAASMASAESLLGDGRRHGDLYGVKIDGSDGMLRAEYYGTAPVPSAYDRQSIGDLSRIGAGGAVVVGHHSSSTNVTQGGAYGSEMKLNGDYTSYSSDDEASISVRNVFNIPKVPLTVKPDPSDPIYQGHVQQGKGTPGDGGYYEGLSTALLTAEYFPDDRYVRPDISFESTHDLYTQAQLQRAQELNLQQHYQLQDIDRSLATMQDQQLDASPQTPIGMHGADNKWMSSSTNVRGGGARDDGGSYLNDPHNAGASNKRPELKPLDVSAGDLLNRTHEELILLLIQLRRQNTQTARAIEQCCTNIHELQNLARTAEGDRKADSLVRLESLKQQLIELEKQYEKEKPLINLVDNMVKLGSLYRGPTAGGKSQLQSPESATLDRLEFNQRMQERRLLQEEQRQWDRTSPNHAELQSKVQQLYQIDKLMQEESGTLQALQRDKENLEKALATLKTRILCREGGVPVAMDSARQQQHTLERELSRVHQLLAANSKKLEKTVSTNARLEQELLVLRQKLQATREHRSMHSVYDSAAIVDGSGQYVTGSVTAVLESELKRAKLLVGDMQRQRQELGQAVRQLTSYGDLNTPASDRSQTDEKHHHEQQMREDQSSKSKHKRSYSSSWVETDLDYAISKDGSHSRTMSSSNSSVLTIDDEMQSLFLPNTAKPADGGDASMDELYGGTGGTYSYGVNAADKQEIKTVRIVKRESERRMRDKEKNDRNLALSLDQVLEEEAQLMEDYQRSKSLPRGYETHEMYVQNHDPRVTTSMDGSSLMSDFYSSVVASANGNSYPVSLIDRQADLYTGHFEPTLQSKYGINGGAEVGDESPSLASARYHYQPQQPPNQQQHYATASNEMPTALGLKLKTAESIQSLTNADAEHGPVFQSEAAKQIINEMATGGTAAGVEAVGSDSGSSSGEAKRGSSTTTTTAQIQQEQQLQALQRQRAESQNRQRRAVPKDKRRHHTAPHHVNAKSIELMHSENDMNKNNVNWRARDDVDLEVTIRPRSNAPDVVRSALGPREKISEHTIDKLLAAPSKILIPERYVPEQTPELSPEEKKRRQEKVEAIKKMLSDTPIGGAGANESGPNTEQNAEKKQREHLIQLNQILAQQVMQMSKIVAGNPSHHSATNAQK